MFVLMSPHYISGEHVSALSGRENKILKVSTRML